MVQKLNLHIVDTASLVSLFCLQLLLIRRSWVVFIYAIAISVESILIEFLTTTFLQITPIMLSAISITLAGIMLLLVALFLTRRKEIATLLLKSWKNLSLASFFLAAGIFTWYDSINRIGASKEVLIAGPLEIVIIVVLAQVFLNEKLNRIQVTGIVLALIGFFISIVSDIGIDVLVGIQTVITSPLPSIPITFGDIEAILSAFGFGIGVLFLTKLVSLHSSIEVAGTSMLISGLILAGFMIGFSYESLQISLVVEGSLFQQPQMLINAIIIVALFSLLPFIGSLIFHRLKQNRGFYYSNHRFLQHPYYNYNTNNTKAIRDYK